MAIKAVFFDLDDTLYSSFAVLDQAAYAAVGDFIRRECGIEGFAARALAGRRTLHDALYGEPEIHDRILQMMPALEECGLNPVHYARRCADLYWATVIDGMELRPGTPELLDALHARGLKTGVCTNMLADRQLEKLERLGLAERFDHFVCSEEAGRDKPFAPIFRLCLKKSGCAPHEAVMVGDNRSHDVAGALSCGLHAVWLNWTGKPPARFPAPHYEARDMAGVGRCLDEIIRTEE